MPNRYYAPDDQRAGKVRDLFSLIAPRYDLINDLQSLGLHRWWKRRLVRLVQAPIGAPTLDVCCGTGDIALALAEQGAEVIGLDFSAPMLAVAANRARIGAPDGGVPRTAARPRTNPRLVRADALKLPFADAQFLAVTIGYGLRNLADWEQGLQEMWRVTKPGGRIGILDFGKPKNALWRAWYLGYLRVVVPWFGRLACGDGAAYGYILESLRYYPNPDAVADLMRRVGFSPVRVVNLLGGIMSIHCGDRPH